MTLWLVVGFGFLALFLGGGWLWYATSRSRESSLQLLGQQVSSLHEQLGRALSDASSASNREIQGLNERIDQRLQATSQLMADAQRGVGDRIDQNTRLFGQVQERLGRMEELGKGVQTVGQDINRLQELLRAPKLRGNLGELFLEELLAQILPRQYFTMQYGFKNGEKVDAVIQLAQGHLVPIDAKFPLENFRRMLEPNRTEAEQKEFRKAFSGDFKKHVDDIAKRYIRPDEGTLDFALLYVPAENIYYEAILRDDRFGEELGINTYALRKRVIPVSPNSLYAYLQAILMGLKGLRIEERAKEIYAFLTRFKRELERLEDEFGLVNKHLSNATSALEKGQKRLERVRGRVAEAEEAETELESGEDQPAISAVKSS